MNLETEKNGFEKCTLCPRACGVNRLAGQLGYCKTGAGIRVARAALHMWEEPCISGRQGSGAVFFSGCNMGCVFCQNHEISGGQAGREITAERLGEIFWELREQGAANINLVTPDHYIPALAPVLREAKAKGFDLPFVYNSSAYVSVDALKKLEGLIDIYLPDYKYDDSGIAAAYSNAPDYPQTARLAIIEMVRQIKRGTSVCSFNQEGMMRRGVIVRHLLLPGQLMAAKRIVKYLHDTYENDIYISLLNQYTPVLQHQSYPELSEPVSAKSYRKLVDYALDIGVEQGFIQEGRTAQESFIPSFDLQGV
ncbi:MAG: radical SAM protein [Lachnospiraceae bacterium]|nr:radical SAM protein [Lachnospiraceae bacterium]